ncbi:MAG: hypothetical protein GY778_28730 [bacterium]|nr:hypothetical protein [bacterium]
MKATRRQELKSNELAQTLDDIRAFLRRYGNYLGIGGAVVLALLAVWFFQSRSAGAARTAALQQMTRLPFTTDEEVRSSIKTLQTLATETTDAPFVIQTLRWRALMAVSRAQAAPDGTPAPEFLDLAEEAYQEILDGYPERHLDVAQALCGLATIEEDRFVLDGDLSHRDQAQAYLERLRDGAEYAGLPMVSVALDRLNASEETFTTIVLAPAPVTAAPDSQAPVGPVPLPTPITVTPGQPVRVGGPSTPGATPTTPPPGATPDPEPAADGAGSPDDTGTEQSSAPPESPAAPADTPEDPEGDQE